MATLQITEFLPEIEGAPPSHDKTGIVVCMHSAACSGCLEYVRSLAPLAAEFADWDGYLLVLAPGTEAPAVEFGSGLSDPERRIADGSAAVLVADRYRHIFHVHEAGTGHSLPAPREIAEWLKYLGTLCPE